MSWLLMDKAFICQDLMAIRVKQLVNDKHLSFSHQHIQLLFILLFNVIFTSRCNIQTAFMTDINIISTENILASFLMISQTNQRMAFPVL